MSRVLTHETDGQFCPACHHFLDAISSPWSEHKPEEGDLTVCLYCSSFLSIGAGGGYNLMTEDQVSELSDETRNQLLKLRYAISKIMLDSEPPAKPS